ncbi:MAG TPA: tetratricopeptide repeat protein [Pyrinomonadaceae bacterium]|nr:tetratricopeptide repeat protein [Pyrinomonadaceae bacterium]
MTSQELGDLFEKASFEILKELFQNWGFQITDSKIQESGIQFGYDEFFKICRENCSLNVYVECKASEKYNKIKSIELEQKIKDLEWTPFPKKDIHILFSPSREIKFRNFEITIENNTYPFVIIDWMRKPKERNFVMELFASYQGDNEEIKKYREFLLTEVDNSFRTIKTFLEVCEELKSEFERRISEHHGEVVEENFRIINGAFWHRTQQNTDFADIHYYYTKIDSTPDRLPQVVANDFYVRNEQAILSFNIKFDQAIKHRKSLIKILSQGGEGKSTFLYHLAKTLCEEYAVVWLYSISSDVFSKIRRKIEQIVTQKPLIFILDNPASFGGDLEIFAEKLIRVFDKHNKVMIVAERSFRYQEIAGRKTFERPFDEVYDIYLRSNKITEQVFEKLMAAFQKDNPFPYEFIEQSKIVFLEDETLSIAEKTYSFIKFLSENNKLKEVYKFDWEDWEEFAAKNAPKLKNLYLLLATFYQFGNALDIEFCASFLDLKEEVEHPEINIFKEHKSLPIYKRGKHLFLRHEKLASWFLEDKNHFENSEYYFKRFLKNINTEFARDLFIWVCIKNKEFRNSKYAGLVDVNNRIEVFRNYINQNPNELKSRTELSKIYQQQRRFKEAEDILLEELEISPKAIHPLVELSKIYQRQRRIDQAIKVLIKRLELDPNGLHPRTELSKIYQKQGKWKDAIQLLEQYIELDPNGLHPRTELSKIYQKQEKWKDAEDVLLELLNLDENNLQARTELSKIYQKQEKWKDAIKILRKCLKIDVNDVKSRTELSKVYQKLSWKYRKQNKLDKAQKCLDKAEKYLKECLNIDEYDPNSLLELGKLCAQNFHSYNEAENLFKKLLTIEPDSHHAKLELADLYRKMKKFYDREKLLFEIYRDFPNDVPTLTTFTGLFKRFKKYRIALELSQKILELRNTDLIAVCDLVNIYRDLGDRKMAELYIERGQRILEKDENHKDKERFQRLRTYFDESVELIDFYKVGYFVEENGQRFIKTEDAEQFIIPEDATFNYKIVTDQKVYFGMYSKNDNTFANFIEPYFENLDDLESLK